MSPPSTAQEWHVYVRSAPCLIAAIFIFSVVELGLSAAHAVSLSKEPVDAYWVRHFGPRGPTGAQLAFYTSTAAVISVIYSPIGYLIYRRSSRRQLFALVGSVVLLLMWICQVSFWTNCEIVPRDDSGVQQYCPQWAMRKRDDELHNGVQMAKYCLGWPVVALYLAYMIVAAIGVGRAKKLEKQSRAGVDDQEMRRLPVAGKLPETSGDVKEVM